MLSPRLKKLIGLLLFLPLMVLYIGIIVTIGDFLPNHWAIYLVYYLITGMVWAFPLKPVLIWMNKPITQSRSDTPSQQA